MTVMTEHQALAREVATPFDETVTKLRDLLAHEGFGVVTELDLSKIFETKLGTPFRRYQILGVCNPSFAYRAVSDHPEVGVMLPCNIALYETEKGGTQVIAVDPMQMASDKHDLADLATEVRARLGRAVSGL